MTNYELSEKIEIFMLRCGQYDYADNDRNKWVRGVADAYELANGRELYEAARDTVCDRIMDDLHNGNIKPLIRYVLKERRLLTTREELLEEDKLVQLADEIIAALKDELSKQPVKEFGFAGAINEDESIEDVSEDEITGWNFELRYCDATLYDRAEFDDESVIYEDFDRLVDETDITLYVDATITTDGDIFVEISYQDDALDSWPTGVVKLTEKEKQTLRADMERAAEYQETSLEGLMKELEELNRE